MELRAVSSSGNSTLLVLSIFPNKKFTLAPTDKLIESDWIKEYPPDKNKLFTPPFPLYKYVTFPIEGSSFVVVILYPVVVKGFIPSASPSFLFTGKAILIRVKLVEFKLAEEFSELSFKN